MKILAFGDSEWRSRLTEPINYIALNTPPEITAVGLQVIAVADGARLKGSHLSAVRTEAKAGECGWVVVQGRKLIAGENVDSMLLPAMLAELKGIEELAPSAGSLATITVLHIRTIDNHAAL